MFPISIIAICISVLGVPKLFKTLLILGLSSIVFAYIMSIFCKKIYRSFFAKICNTEKQGWYISWLITVFILISIISLISYYILPSIGKQILYLFSTLNTPKSYNGLTEILKEKLNINIDPDIFDIKNILSILGQIVGIEKFYYTGTAITHGIIMGIIWLIVSINILKEWHDWEENILSLMGFSYLHKKKSQIRKFLKRCDVGLKDWIKGQVFVSFVLSCYYAIFFYYAKFPIPMLLSIVSGFSSFIPYVGDFITAGFVGSAISLADSQFSSIILIGMLVWILLGHAIGSYILIPTLVGHKTQVHPIQIMFGFVMFGNMFGIMGVVLNIPIWVLLNAFYREFIKPKEEVNNEKDDDNKPRGNSATFTKIIENRI